MIVQKSILNDINKKYINLIKKLHLLNIGVNLKEEYALCSKIIAGKKVEFYLVYTQSLNKNNDIYLIGAHYTPWQINKKYRVIINVETHTNLFLPKYYCEINLRIKSLIYHEIEHHLQRIKIPFRADLDLKAYITGQTIDYINSDAEIEAYVKQYYFMHKKSGIDFTKLLNQEAEHISDNIFLRQRFKKRIFKFIKQRKDLNLFLNIKF